MITEMMKGDDMLRIGFKTTLEKELIDKLKIEAIKQGVNVNDILEVLIKKYLDGEIDIKNDKK